MPYSAQALRCLPICSPERPATPSSYPIVRQSTVRHSSLLRVLDAQPATTRVASRGRVKVVFMSPLSARARTFGKITIVTAAPAFSVWGHGLASDARNRAFRAKDAVAGCLEFFYRRHPSSDER